MSLRSPNRNTLRNVAAINLASSQKKALPPENIGLNLVTDQEHAIWEQIVAAKPYHDWRKVDLIRLLSLIQLLVQSTMFWSQNRGRLLDKEELAYINSLERAITVVQTALGLALATSAASNPFTNAQTSVKNGEFSSPLLKGAQMN